MTAVSNAELLIHLTKIGKLNLLRDIFKGKEKEEKIAQCILNRRS